MKFKIIRKKYWLAYKIKDKKLTGAHRKLVNNIS